MNVKDAVLAQTTIIAMTAKAWDMTHRWKITFIKNQSE
jgi:hypothetical protein